MTIVSAETKPCVQRQSDAGWTFARAAVPDIRGWTIVLTDDAGRIGLGYGHALPTVTANSETTKAALDFLLPRLIGRDGADIAAIMEEVDIALALAPAAKAGIDMALHDLLARKLDVPLNVLFGGAMRKTIPQGRIVPLKQPAEMAEHAAKLAAEGYPMIKVKFSGDADLDTARIAAVRKAVGPKTILTIDTNQTYSAKGFINTFSRIEQYDIKLVEQPVTADDWQGLALCTRTLPVAVEADESAGSLADVAKLVSGRMCDVINLKVTKLGGIRNTLKAVGDLRGRRRRLPARRRVRALAAAGGLRPYRGGVRPARIPLRARRAPAPSGRSVHAAAGRERRGNSADRVGLRRHAGLACAGPIWYQARHDGLQFTRFHHRVGRSVHSRPGFRLTFRVSGGPGPHRALTAISAW